MYQWFKVEIATLGYTYATFYLPQFLSQNHSHATRTLAVVECVWTRLVRFFQWVTAVVQVVWEVVHTHRTTAPVYHVHKVNLICSTMQQGEFYWFQSHSQSLQCVNQVTQCEHINQVMLAQIYLHGSSHGYIIATSWVHHGYITISIPCIIN